MLRLKILLQSDYIYYILIIIALILTIFRIYVIKYESKYDLKDNLIIGKVINIKYKNEKTTLTIKSKEKLIGYYKGETYLKLGDIVQVKGELYKPINNTIPNVFNYKKYLNNNKIYYLLSISEIKLLKENKSILYKTKDYLNNKIFGNVNAADYLSAFILGDLTHLEKDTLEKYQNNGVIHLFSISGMQINLLAFTTLFLLKKIKINQIIKYIFVALVLIFFSLIINYSASVLRSVVFFIIISINKLFHLNISTKNNLFLTVIVLLLFNPLIIFDIGFQYSAIITYGLIISSKRQQKKYILNLLYTSFIATLFSMPITLFNNYEINVLSPISNLIFVPLITYIIYPVSIATLFISYLTPIFNLLINIMENINNFFAYFSLFQIIIPKVSIFLYLLYYIILIIYIYSFNKKYLYLCLLLILSFKTKYIFDPSTYVFFLDVGQGDSTLIYNRKESILIDTGGVYNYDVSNNTIKFMKSLGITKINLLLITHGDLDHAKDAPNIIKKYKVKNVVFNCGTYNDLENKLIKLVEEKNIKYFNCIKEFNFDNSKLNFLNNKTNGDENDNSSVIYTELNSHKFLFMADAGLEVEEEIIKKYKLKDIDVLKVGHHGSKTSTGKEFIAKIEPKYSIISVGRNNRYGHPNEGVLKILQESKIYRTDQDGSIMFKIKKNILKNRTYLPHERHE